MPMISELHNRMKILREAAQVISCRFLTAGQEPLRSLSGIILPGTRQLLRLVCRDQRINEFIEIAVHDLVDPVQCQLDPMVRHPSLREIVGPDLFTPVS